MQKENKKLLKALNSMWPEIVLWTSQIDDHIHKAAETGYSSCKTFSKDYNKLIDD